MLADAATPPTPRFADLTCFYFSDAARARFRRAGDCFSRDMLHAIFCRRAVDARDVR